MKKSGKCGVKTGQEAAWSDLTGKAAFCRYTIGVTKVRVESLSHPVCCELWPQHFLFLAADSSVSHQPICPKRAIKGVLREFCCFFG